MITWALSLTDRETITAMMAAAAATGVEGCDCQQAFFALITHENLEIYNC